MNPKRFMLKQSNSQLISLMLLVPLPIKPTSFPDLYTTVTNQDFFNPTNKRTLEKQGVKTVYIFVSNAYTKGLL